ncbi:MAG: glycosyltransferase family 2 protein [Microbacterium sp.]|uniref:glycosyltransferase family 2 protein n=1 Tax=Microbacterium sp. TaxID=51671 RepID=UPI002724FD04|nr:glycosyltransferase family 2 protein [Microbacterium sp.]MDO8383771.1 glycosyltransferase family 2 protein [Microbacterium sp.]
MPQAVTVVVATRSRPQLLRRALASIAAQEYPADIEILVVFDGTDIDDLSDLTPTPGRVIRTMPNARRAGLAGARNTGIEAARNPLLGFCDDDDEWKPTKLAQQTPLLNDAGVVVSATGIEIHSAGGTHQRFAPEKTNLDDLLRSRITELHPSSFVLRTEDLRGRLGLVDEELPASYGEDYDLLLRAVKLGSIAAVQDALTIVHWDRTSFFSEKWQGIVDGLSYLLAKHPEFARSRLGTARIEGQIAFAYAALGDRQAARGWARRTLGHHPLQPRAYIALMVGLGLVKGETVVAALNKRGRGM